tara:strand:- start:63 stop:806 length:744 start_codon:yes stop_codon:yes gene_type:complete
MYNAVNTRGKHTGVVDKLALMEAMARKWAKDRTYGEAILAILRNCGSAADAQVACLERYFASLPYRREYNEIYRSPLEVVGDPRRGIRGVGGDCDDLSIAFAAAALHLSIPVYLEIAADQQGWGFHVRVRVGLPPTHPTNWAVIDPVWRSEREWAMIGKDPKSGALKRHFQQTTQRKSSAETAAPTPPPSKSCPAPRYGTWFLLLLMGGLIGFFASPQPPPCPPLTRKQRRRIARSRRSSRRSRASA